MSNAMHRGKVGFTHLRHNEIPDTFTKSLDKTCFHVEFETTLQSLQRATFFKQFNEH